MNLISVTKKYGTQEAALDFLQSMRWPDGVECLKCGGTKISKYSTKEGTRQRTRKNKETGAKETIEVPVPVRHLYECLDPKCGHQFTATTGTIFSDTHIGFEKWLVAVALMVNAKKGLSAMEMQRDIDVKSYQTAWYLCHRIRKAMDDEKGSGEPLKGSIEADETYIGGKFDKRRKRQRWDKEPVFGMVERGGEVRTWHIPQVNRFHVIDKIKGHISDDAKLYTDESKLYKRLPKNVGLHEIVNHSEKEWVRGEAYTGTIDGYWSLLKRGIIGSFHQVSVKHLHRYLSEFEFRWNNRESEDMFMMVVARLLMGAALRYKTLIAKPETATPAFEPLALDDEPF